MGTYTSEQTFQLAVIIFASSAAFFFLILLGIHYFTRSLVEEYKRIVDTIKEKRKKLRELKKKVEQEVEELSKVPHTQLARSVETVVKAEEKK